MTDPVLEIHELARRFGRHEVLRGVDLQVPRGELFGFLGQNGAGKTTTIRILARLLRADRGRASLLGRDVASTAPRALFQGVGFLVETPEHVPHLTGRENLAVHARLCGLRPADAGIDRLLARVGLSAAADRRAREYSLGMRQRLGLAQAMIGDPELLILDEPTNGLDPGGIIEVREALLTEVRERGRTIFLSSHLLSEVEVLCSRVAVIDEGRIVGEGAVDDLLRSGETVRVRTSSPRRAHAVLGEAAARVEAGEPAEVAATSGEEAAEGLRLRGDDAAVARAVAALVAAGIDVYEVTRRRRSLEEVYRDLTGNGTAGSGTSALGGRRAPAGTKDARMDAPGGDP